MASVTLSGAWRAKYSLRASENWRLRDLVVQPASRSGSVSLTRGTKRRLSREAQKPGRAKIPRRERGQRHVR